MRSGRITFSKGEPLKLYKLLHSSSSLRGKVVVMVVMVRLDENQRQIDNEQEYEKAILESYYDDADEQ